MRFSVGHDLDSFFSGLPFGGTHFKEKIDIPAVTRQTPEIHGIICLYLPKL